MWHLGVAAFGRKTMPHWAMATDLCTLWYAFVPVAGRFDLLSDPFSNACGKATRNGVAQSGFNLLVAPVLWHGFVFMPLYRAVRVDGVCDVTGALVDDRLAWAKCCWRSKRHPTQCWQCLLANVLVKTLPEPRWPSGLRFEDVGCARRLGRGGGVHTRVLNMDVVVANTQYATAQGTAQGTPHARCAGCPKRLRPLYQPGPRRAWAVRRWR